MKRVLVVAVGVIVVLSLGAGAVGWYVYDTLTSPFEGSPISGAVQATVEAGDDPGILFEIEPGNGLRLISRRMAADGLIRSAWVLEGYARWKGYSGALQAGRYLLSPLMSPVEMLGTIVSGDAVFDELTVTIPEGWSANDIEVYFEGRGLFTKDRFQKAVVMQEAYRDILVLAPLEDNTILDGYLFPDTYRIFSDSTPESVVRRMLLNFERRVGPWVSEIEGQGRTLHDVLTLASIVQHESADDAETPDVAGVFWNRLQIGMRLESDATVNYVLGTSKRQPTFADTAVQDPYNTYENAGLPPGPIGNPGLPAILATITPAEHDFLFFLHKPSREIVMTRTFEDHLAAKARYLD
ncbi:MAG: endolytic transglycosylase MltG [Alkalispirochaeta sp.]